MKKILSYGLWSLFILAIMGGIIWWIGFFRQNPQEVLRAAFDVTAPSILGGTSAALKSMPTSSLGIAGFFEGSATTTQLGDTWQQNISIEGADKIALNIKAIGGTATSTMYIRPQVSYNGTDYFYPQADNLAVFVTTSINYVTSTLPITFKTYIFTPGLATTSYSYVLDFAPAKYLRLMLLGDDVALDPDDKVRAYITYSMKEGK